MTDYNGNRSWLVAYRDLSRVLDVAVAQRSQRETVEQTTNGDYIMTWTVFEREQMLIAVNELRARRALPPVGIDDVAVADDAATGHINWQKQFAAGCANLALGRSTYRETRDGNHR